MHIFLDTARPAEQQDAGGIHCLCPLVSFEPLLNQKSHKKDIYRLQE